MSSKAEILDGAVAMLRAGATVSLESAARQAGLTKPGVMYHFPTKEALMVALLDRVVDGWERDLAARLHRPLEQTPPGDRIRAYLGWALDCEVDQGDLVMFADPRLRDQLTGRWVERMRPWLELPDELPADERARLMAVRLIAEGTWFAEALCAFPPEGASRDHLRALALNLLEGIE
ncbi:TetR family transcriptional regulator [Glycomyces sp. TRM65418]|uniref:TetR/AcrR family transcriptional regulator n=1 Tax=Glycomyces sp. TRM65418 TaxID=2867006 RepID=UPI001CE5E406|nr:TetR family transcriptional regulator [Glycomyces sp. TRM65418]MCC3764336.1 TetR family transcriptional regulator [Glycomyces sp. TRM65418]QZD54015.1 TetR family transcriptional regulator [Glycomyces sp. TRM65418]